MRCYGVRIVLMRCIWKEVMMIQSLIGILFLQLAGDLMFGLTPTHTTTSTTPPINNHYNTTPSTTITTPPINNQYNPHISKVKRVNNLYTHHKPKTPNKDSTRCELSTTCALIEVLMQLCLFIHLFVFLIVFYAIF